MKKFSISVLILGAVAASLGCADVLSRGAKSSDQSEGALLAGALGLACNLGGQLFTAGGGVACGPATAGGTGSLVATAASGDILSMELWFTVGSGGAVNILGGTDPYLILSGSGVNFTTSGVLFHGAAGSTELASVTLVPFPNVLKIVCVEFHELDNPLLIAADNAPCTGKTVASASSHSTSIAGSAVGRGWGFVLSNAVIWKLQVNPSLVFAE